MWDRRGDIARCDRIMRSCSRHFMRLTGTADTIPAYLASGGCGAVTGIGNLAPRLLGRIRDACRAEAFEQAQILQRRLIPLYNLLAREPDAVAIKLALSLQHPSVNSDCRLPLVAAAPSLVEKLKYALDDFTPALQWSRNQSRFRRIGGELVRAWSASRGLRWFYAECGRRVWRAYADVTDHLPSNDGGRNGHLRSVLSL